MRRVREILRLKHEVKLSHREVAGSLGVSTGVVSKVVKREALAGLGWAAVAELSEEEVEARLYGAQASPGAARWRPDPEWIHTERKRAGVTLELEARWAISPEAYDARVIVELATGSDTERKAADEFIAQLLAERNLA